MNAVTKITEAVYAELQSLMFQSADVADHLDEKGIDDMTAIMITRSIKEAMARVTAVQGCAKWMDAYERGTDMSTDMLMKELEELPASLREDVEAQAAKL